MINDLSEIIRVHAEKYPLMQPQDAVKLVYQNEFGGGHMVGDRAASLERLKNERRGLSSCENQPCGEDIGKGLCRINLASAEISGLDSELINSMFVYTANSHCGTLDGFKEKLKQLYEISENGGMPFTAAALKKYLGEYEKEGFSAVRHSDIYRENYNPSYRVVYSGYLRIVPLIKRIAGLLKNGGRAVVGMDGRAASGKTTAARYLESLFDCNIIHMDDFFLPFDLRTAERYVEVGGNVHYERFNAEVADGIRNHGGYSYRVFDCASGDYSCEIKNEAKPLTLVEGAYALHPLYEDIYNLKVFSDISPYEQEKRILERNGGQGLQSFLDRWIPLENKYIDALGIIEKCDLIL